MKSKERFIHNNNNNNNYYYYYYVFVSYDFNN